jgi:hypothetical protein
MASLKSIAPVASWMLRLSVLVLIYHKYSDTLMTLEYHETHFYYSLAFVLSGLFLFVGGFFKNQVLTMLCGFVIAVLPVVLLFMNDFLIDEAIRQFVLISLGVYFFVNGND